MARRVLAVAAHPDDVEFLMAGTLLRLKAAGYAIHMLNIASGSCGSSTTTSTSCGGRRRDRRSSCRAPTRG